MPKTANTHIKCVLVGSGAEEKIELAVTYSKDEYPSQYIPMVFENYIADVQVGSKSYELALWDTAGSTDYDRFRPLTYPDTDVFMIIFSVVSRSNFESIRSKWIPEIRHFTRRVPFVIVGTRIECRDDPNYLETLSGENQKPISYEEGIQVAKELGAYKYVECSPIKNIGVKEVFHEAILAAIDCKT